MIQIGGIILCVNGMNVGGMTENELYHYIDNNCESQIIIVLARKVINSTMHMHEMVSSKIVTNSDDDDEDLHEEHSDDLTRKKRTKKPIKNVKNSSSSNGQIQKKWEGKCACGQKHTKKQGNSSDIFWIQCDTCETWYRVAKGCVGMTYKEATELTGEWSCPTCEELSISSSDSESESLC